MSLREQALRRARRWRRGDAEDLVQDAYLRLLRAGREVDRASLMTALRSAAVDALRRERASKRHLDEARTATLRLALARPEPTDSRVEVAHLLRRVEDLPGRHARTLLAHLRGEQVSRSYLSKARRAAREAMIDR